LLENVFESVFVSITTLDPDLKRTLEPRAAAPSARLAAIKRLNDAGVPVGVMVAPVIPALTDHELENILEQAATSGAGTAGYVMLRLPYEVAGLFAEWLELNQPLKASHVMSRIKAIRGGRDNDPAFGSRMRGAGRYAELFEQRFALATRKLGLDRNEGRFDLDTARFKPPQAPTPQQSLF
jgi:DNA repair photolyase